MNAEELYYEMAKIRAAELILQREYPENQIRTPVHTCLGAEAIAVGVLHAFAQRKIYGSYRNHHWYLASTQDFEGFWGELYARTGAPSEGRAGSMHLCLPEKGYMLSSAVVSSTLPLAVGHAWADRSSQVICFFGDGATEEGVFWESLNMARLKRVPVLFVCEDNDLSIHTAKDKRQSYDLPTVLKSFGIPYLSTWANDVFEVASIALEAKRRLAEGPVFLHFSYHRMLEHVGVREDYAKGYRIPPVDPLINYDPVVHLQMRLAPGRAETLMESAFALVEEARQKVIARPSVAPDTIERHIFKDSP